MGIRKRLDELPIFEYRDDKIDASHYNLVHIALKRLGKSLRFELPRLRTLDLILEEDVWVVVDRDLNDIPIIAWVDFQTQHRQSLHEPIPCQLRIYHAHAMMIISKVMEAMHVILGEKLSKMTTANGEIVTSIKSPN